jgi:hypothetical protein
VATLEQTHVTAYGPRSVETVGVLDVSIAVLLSVAAVAMVTGHLGTIGRHGGVLAGLAAVTLTFPVAWRRRAPIVAAGALLAGALINEFGIGPMERCGPGLPALFLVGYALGRRERGWRPGLAACGFLAGAAYLEVHYDPAIRKGGLPMAAVLSAICVVCWGAGRMLRSRAAMVAVLEVRTAELTRQRDDNARLAVAADRGRIADDVNRELDDRLAEVVAQAGHAQALIAEQTERAQEIFAGIQGTARSTLTNLRRSVTTLLTEDLPHHPAPVLAELTQLVEGRQHRDTRLLIDGSPQSLPAGLELSAYRIVERLLEVLAKAPGAKVEVTVRFEPDVLEIVVAGHGAPAVELEVDGAVAAARQRAALHGGTLVAERRDAGWWSLTRLPLAVAID